MKILLVEDDPDLAAMTERVLARHNYVVDIAENLAIARSAVQDNSYSLVLLDRRLPDGDGTELIEFMRRKSLPTRFLVLSALGKLNQRVEGLELGADDYIVKPFEEDELIARIRAAERRPLPELSKVVEAGNLSFHCNERNFFVSGEPLILPRREMTVLECLVRGAGRVVTREHLEAEMYGYDDEIQSNSLDAHVSRLRKQLAQRRATVKIDNIRGVGYVLSTVE